MMCWTIYSKEGNIRSFPIVKYALYIRGQFDDVSFQVNTNQSITDAACHHNYKGWNGTPCQFKEAKPMFPFRKCGHGIGMIWDVLISHDGA
eukprot:1819781-Ditylum_brightwellii.AAC.1